MTATEEIRARLDELGVEWIDTGDGSTLIPAQDATGVAWDVNVWPSGKDMGDCLWVQNRHPLTPEQAIAVTVGAVPETKYLMALDEARDVQRKLEMCQTSQKVYQSKCRSLKETNANLCRIIDDMKAATVGAGTCRDLGGTGADGEDMFNCSECGCVLSLYDGEGVNTLCTSFIYDYPRFCPACGRKVIESKEEAE